MVKPGSSGANVLASPDGSMVAVCWPDDARYQVFARTSLEGPATQWKAIDEGSGGVVCWHQTNNWLGVLMRPKSKDRLPASIDKKAYKVRRVCMYVPYDC